MQTRSSKSVFVAATSAAYLLDMHAYTFFSPSHTCFVLLLILKELAYTVHIQYRRLLVQITFEIASQLP